MDYNTFDRLKPISSIKDRSEYQKVRKRLKTGAMTSYIWNKNLYFDSKELETYNVRVGRKLNDDKSYKKPIVDVDDWLKTKF